MNQEELNKMGLQEASEYITDMLVEQTTKLYERRKELFDNKAQYENDYIEASKHGDASENAPLDEAKKNLRLVAGDIAANAEILNALGIIEDTLYLRDIYDNETITKSYGSIEDSVFIELVKSHITSESIKDSLSRMKSKDVNLLLSAISNYAKDNTERNILLFVNSIRDYYETVASKPNYNCCGLVKTYTTVRLRLDSKIYTFKIYPEKLSFVDIGIIALNSRLGAGLINKSVGGEVVIPHASKGTLLKYEVLDIY